MSMSDECNKNVGGVQSRVLQCVRGSEEYDENVAEIR